MGKMKHALMLARIGHKFLEICDRMQAGFRNARRLS